DPLALLGRGTGAQHVHLGQPRVGAEPRLDRHPLAPDVLDRLGPGYARIGYEQIYSQRAVVSLRLALVTALRELERPPRPGEQAIGLEVPFVLLGGLNAEAAHVRAEEAKTPLLHHAVRVLAAVLARFPVGRKFADLRFGKVLDRQALGLSADGRRSEHQ